MLTIYKNRKKSTRTPQLKQSPTCCPFSHFSWAKYAEGNFQKFKCVSGENVSACTLIIEKES